VDVGPATPPLYVLTDDLGPRVPKVGCGLAQPARRRRSTQSARTASIGWISAARRAGR
jgi:hypothetical protein